MIKMQYEMLGEACSFKNSYNACDVKKTASNIIGANIFDLQDLGFAISYLLSLVEGKSYEVTSVNVDGDAKLKMIYAVARENIENAQEEMEERFGRNGENEETIEYKRMQGLTMPATNYVQLGIIKNEKLNILQHVLQGLNPTEGLAALKLIKESNPDFLKCQDGDFVRFEGVLDWRPQFFKNYSGCLNVIDNNYAFIMDFMTFLVDYRLKKQEGNFAISIEELMMLTETFAEEYKNKQGTGSR